MRKNTLIKLLAVLAMCFLIGAALVSCGEEAEDETAKTIVGVEFVGDDLVITYDDGTKTTTAIPAAAECTHENAKAYSLVDHGVRDVNDEGYDPANPESRFVNGVILNVCNDCRGAWTTEGVLHVGYTTVETGATCLEPAYVATVCDVPGCGAHFDKHPEGEIGGHKYVVTIEGDYCTGGTKVETCSICAPGTEGHEIRTPIEATAEEGFDGRHTVAEWTIVEEPTFAAAGVIAGQCTKEGCTLGTVVKEIPKLTKKASDDTYTFAIADPRESCKDSGEYTYTHKATGEVVTVVEEGTADHYLEGQLMIPSTSTTHKVYRVEDFKAGAIVEFDNHKIVNCYEEELAVFYCDAVHDNGATCKEPVTIWAAKAHTASDWMDDPNNTATCEKVGKEIKICTVCKAAGINTVLETRDKAKLPHDIVYSETLYADANGAAVLDITKLENVGAKAYRFGDCSKCDHTQYDEVADFKSEITVKTTCQAPGKFTVTYTKVSGEAVKQDFVIAQLAHKLNGIELVLHTDATPKIYTVAELKAIKADVVLIAPDNTDPNLNYDVYGIQCDCVCGCPTHIVSIRVAK